MAGETRRLIAAIALVAIGAAATAKYQPPGADLLRKIDQQGAQSVLEDDFNLDGGPGYPVVETGSAEGVAVAVKLLTTVADAAYSEGLQSSLGKALQRHPGNVLRLVGTHPLFGAGSICLPFLPEESSRAKIEAQLARTRLALDRPVAKAYPVERAACLAEVARVERSNR